MLELFKELWYKRKARLYWIAVRKVTQARIKLKEKQAKYTERAEHYGKLYEDISKL